MHIWGCPTKARLYNPHEKKLDSRTVSEHFIGYLERFKGYMFYCPSHNPIIVKTVNVKFIEFSKISGSTKLREVIIEGVYVDVPNLRRDNCSFN